jgi:hypothetical protein
MKISFSGHETFVCRQFWLKKGYDFLTQNPADREEPVVSLGVGKNMVTSIRFWLKGFNIIDHGEHPSSLGTFLFNDTDGRDPFLEDLASLWLLHYSILKNEGVYIFNSVFNEFGKEKSEFTKEQLLAFLKRKTVDGGLNLFSDKTYESDVNVFLRTYIRSQDSKADIEEETANLLIDLELISTFHKEQLGGKRSQWYRINKTERRDLSKHLFLFAVLDNYGEQAQSLSFYELLEGYNSPGIVFSLTEHGLDYKLTEIAEHWQDKLSYTQTAGNRVLQLKQQFDKWEVLRNHYA